MRCKPILFVLTVVILAGILAACDDNLEDTRSIVTVASINENAPFFSDVLAQGDSVYDKSGVAITRDDYVVEDWVKIVFYNKAYDPINTSAPGEPYGEVIITNYRIEWERVDNNGTDVPNTYYGATSVVIPVGETVEGGILLVPFYEKNRAYLQELNYLGPRIGEEVLCIAHITFYAHEVGVPSRELTFTASLSVNFGDIIVKTRPDEAQ
jgi:hypothetical protein